MSLERFILIIVPAIFLVAFMFLIFIQNKRNVLSNKVIETGTYTFRIMHFHSHIFSIISNQAK